MGHRVIHHRPLFDVGVTETIVMAARLVDNDNPMILNKMHEVVHLADTTKEYLLFAKCVYNGLRETIRFVYTSRLQQYPIHHSIKDINR